MYRGFLVLRDIALISFALSRKNAEVFQNYNVPYAQINSRKDKYSECGSAKLKNHRFFAIFRKCFEVFIYFEIDTRFHYHFRDLVSNFQKSIAIIGRIRL